MPKNRKYLNYRRCTCKFDCHVHQDHAGSALLPCRAAHVGRLPGFAADVAWLVLNQIDDFLKLGQQLLLQESDIIQFLLLCLLWISFCHWWCIHFLPLLVLRHPDALQGILQVGSCPSWCTAFFMHISLPFFAQCTLGCAAAARLAGSGRAGWS